MLIPDSPSTSPSPAAAESLLSDLLAAFGKLPPRAARKPASKKPASLAAVLPLHKAFSARKTGYVTWKATSRVLQVQEQECSCCGGRIEYIKAEFFALENGTAHATWLRPEGYGIVAPEDLPIVYVDLDPVFTPGCASCRTSPFDELDSLFHPKQLSLDL